MAKQILEIPNKEVGGFEVIARLKGSASSAPTLSVSLYKSYKFIEMRGWCRATGGTAVDYAYRYNNETGTSKYLRRAAYNNGAANSFINGVAYTSGLTVLQAGNNVVDVATFYAVVGASPSGAGYRITYVDMSITQTGSLYCFKGSDYWANTADEISSIQFVPSASVAVNYDIIISGK